VAENVYKVIELIGTSTQSWELAPKAAVERAKCRRSLRVCEAPSARWRQGVEFQCEIIRRSPPNPWGKEKTDNRGIRPGIYG
jgi:flavin-binding protein dodecin